MCPVKRIAAKNVMYAFVHGDCSPTHSFWLQLLQEEVMGFYIVILSPHCSDKTISSGGHAFKTIVAFL